MQKVKYYHLQPRGNGNGAITARTEVRGDEVLVTFAFFANGKTFTRKDGRKAADEKAAKGKFIEKPFYGANSFESMIAAFNEVPKPRTFADLELDRDGKIKSIGLLSWIRNTFNIPYTRTY